MTTEFEQIKKIIQEELFKKNSMLLEAPAGDDSDDRFEQEPNRVSSADSNTSNQRGRRRSASLANDRTKQSSPPKEDSDVFTNNKTAQDKQSSDVSEIPANSDSDISQDSEQKVVKDYTSGFQAYNSLLAQVYVQAQTKRGDVGIMMQQITKQALEQLSPSDNSLLDSGTQISAVDIMNIIRVSMLNVLKQVQILANREISKAKVFDDED